jgi:membrane AbrB-like protein
MMRFKLARSWGVLIVLTLALTAVMRVGHVPGALMLGPLVAGMIVAIYLPGARIPRRLPIVAQAVLGCVIARVMSPELLAQFLPHWPLIVVMNLLMIFGIFALGVGATWLRLFPGTAGIWGMSPGGASTMVVLSEAYGGDKRIVALMHYLRLIWAVLAVIAMAMFLGSPRHGDPGVPLPGMAGTIWFPPIDAAALAISAALVVVGLVIARLLRSPLLAIFFPLFGGVAVQLFHWGGVQVPPVASALAFCVIGWNVGLSFTRESLAHSARLVPRILAGIVAILLLCVGLAALAAAWAHVDFLTAYMALNPGGVDVVLLTAASIDVDLPLIMTMQISRLILVILIAPILGRMAASRHQKSQDADTPADSTQL